MVFPGLASPGCLDCLPFLDLGLPLSYAACLQVGLAEMRGLVSATGGLVCLAETFSHDIFRKTLTRLFSTRESKGGFNATLEVFCPREIKLQGAIGPCASARKPGGAVAESSVGVVSDSPLSGPSSASRDPARALTSRRNLYIFFNFRSPRAAQRHGSSARWTRARL